MCGKLELGGLEPSPGSATYCVCWVTVGKSLHLCASGPESTNPSLTGFLQGLGEGTCPGSLAHSRCYRSHSLSLNNVGAKGVEPLQSQKPSITSIRSHPSASPGDGF